MAAQRKDSTSSGGSGTQTGIREKAKQMFRMYDKEQSVMSASAQLELSSFL